MSRPSPTLLLCLILAMPALAATPPQELAVDALPAGSVRTDGNAPLHVRVHVEEGKVRGFEATTAGLANLSSPSIRAKPTRRW